MNPPDVVLVHGLFHQPAHMEELAGMLRREGAIVHTPRLHRGSLAEDVATVQAVVDGCESAPVLLGHSYGGAVIADVHGGCAQVFVAAFVPDAGESCAELGGPDALINPWVSPHPSGGSCIDPEDAIELFYADCSRRDAERAAALLVPQAGGHGRGIVQDATWKSAPSHYIVCSEDRAVGPALQRLMAERCTSNQTVATSHSPYISQPGLVAEAVLQVETAEPGRGS
ncbi:alpha/beta hydrolase [Brachybacterium tyrofermentans]|uniref:alpha/beta hydrolase n=1 Tax=Brachybacterium tyrofermentans TaxID=47848 RepID=UPI003F8FE1DD